MFCSCVKNHRKVIVEELMEAYELNEGLSIEELLNYLTPLIYTNPVAYMHYETLKSSLTKKATPSAIIDAENAYLWLVKFYS